MAPLPASLAASARRVLTGVKAAAGGASGALRRAHITLLPVRGVSPLTEPFPSE